MRPKLFTLAALVALFLGGLTFTGTADARPRGFYGGYGPYYGYRYAAPYRYYGYRYSYPGYNYPAFGYPAYSYPAYYSYPRTYYSYPGSYGAPVYFGARPGIYYRF
jgi:hypothetical protein